MRTSFRHQSEAQPPNGTLTAATSPDTHLHAQPGSLVSVGYVWVAGAFITKMKTSIPQDWIDYSNSRKVTSSGDYHFSSDIHRSWRPRLIGPDSCESCYT